MKYFAGVKTVEELRKKYRELLKKYHPDNENGSVKITQEINNEYDRLFAILSKENNSDIQSYTYEENEHFKEGRPKKFSKTQVSHALELLNEYSYKRVEQMTGISKSSLIRARKNKIQVTD